MRAHTVVNRDAIVRTQLDDLQSEIEAGARKLNTIAGTAGDMRAELLDRRLEQAHIAGTLVRRIQDLQECIRQQRARLGDLRKTVRARRR